MDVCEWVYSIVRVCVSLYVFAFMGEFKLVSESCKSACYLRF